MEWLWIVIAMAVAGAVTWLIEHYHLSSKIAQYAQLADDVKKDVVNVFTVVTDAFKPDPDGSVRLTPEEVTAFKEALAKLLSRFGIKV